MIPVDEAIARNWKGWGLSFPPRLEALQTRTRRLVLRADTGPPARGKAAVRAVCRGCTSDGSGVGLGA